MMMTKTKGELAMEDLAGTWCCTLPGKIPRDISIVVTFRQTDVQLRTTLAVERVIWCAMTDLWSSVVKTVEWKEIMYIYALFCILRDKFILCRSQVVAEPLNMDLDLPVDPNEPTYCFCNQVSYGEMIACDNPDCKIEWFHYGCVGIKERPKGKWYCHICVDKRRKGK
eukprot:Gb_27859 [translate_table: standard]